MNSPEPKLEAAPPFDVRRCTTEAVINVLNTMLKLPAEPIAAIPALPGSRVTGTISFVGDTVVGGLYFNMLEPFARQAAVVLLALQPEDDISEAEINDVVCELTNMMGSRVKSALCDANYACGISTPSIVRGAAFEIEAFAESQRERFAFNCQSNRIIVDVHIKFN